MALLEQIQKDMTAAMKAREESRLGALRMIKAALMKYKVDTMKDLDDAAEQQILKSLVKQRSDSAEMFRKGGRPELADKEDTERALIESYLPAAASEATSIKQMGLVMKAAQARLAGKTVDGKALSERVKGKLK
jgi:uncharacterized protein